MSRVSMMHAHVCVVSFLGLDCCRDLVCVTQFVSLDDICLDAPHAKVAFFECVTAGEKEGFLPAGFRDSLIARPQSPPPSAATTAP
jgi:hypothetical protein